MQVVIYAKDKSLEIVKLLKIFFVGVINESFGLKLIKKLKPQDLIFLLMGNSLNFLINLTFI